MAGRPLGGTLQGWRIFDRTACVRQKRCGGRDARQAVGIFQFSFLRLVPGAQEGSRCAKVGIFESGIVHNGTCLFQKFPLTKQMGPYCVPGLCVSGVGAARSGAQPWPPRGDVQKPALVGYPFAWQGRCLSSSTFPYCHHGKFSIVRVGLK